MKKQKNMVMILNRKKMLEKMNKIERKKNRVNKQRNER